MIYRYILGEGYDPYHNLAVEQLLLQKADSENILLYLWENRDTIVVGRNQDVYVECKAEEFLAAGGKIARRKSGGGAVYHDFGNLNYSIISSMGAEDRCKYQDLVLEALSLLGIHAEFNGRNDLLADGRKFSGNAVYHNGTVICQHGTLLVSSNLEKMEYFLTPNAEKLGRNGVKSVASRVMNLSEMFSGLTVARVRDALIEATGAEPLMPSLDKEEVRKLATVYAGDRWIFGREFG